MFLAINIFCQICSATFFEKFCRDLYLEKKIKKLKSRNFQYSLNLTSYVERPYANYPNESSFILMTLLMTSQHDDKVALYIHV